MLFYFVYFTYVCFVYPSGFNSFFLNNMFHLYCFVFLDHFYETEKNTTRWKHFKKIPHGRNISKKYHTVETFKKNTTRSKHFKKIPHGRNISKSNRKIAERGKIDTSKNTYYTGPLNFLDWHRHLKWRG